MAAWLLATLLSGSLTSSLLLCDWSSALLQILLVVVNIYVLKYGWHHAPAELWRRTRSFLSFFASWVPAREPPRFPWCTVKAAMCPCQSW